MESTAFHATYKTLQERMEARDRISKETGHYWGIEKLTLRDRDPVKFDRFNSRLVAAVMGARETGKFIAASPAATGMGELVFGLMTREGDVPAGSLGLVGHNATMPIVVESFAKLGYDASAGINAGDIWECNDPFYGAPHAADCFTFVPIIYKGEHIGWAGGVNHISEVGGLIPGAVPTVAPNVFVEGFDYPVIRTGQNDKLFPWWENQWRRRTRLGAANVLDAKMRMGGCLMLRDRILEVCEEFGADYVVQGMAEVLERERSTMQKRLRNWTMPGTYNFPLVQPVKYKGKLGLLFPEANKDWLLHFPLEATLGNGRVHYDFSGASNQDWHHYNMYLGSLRFGVNLAWYPVFIVGENMHTGNVYLMDFERPLGSVTNPSNPFVGTPSSAVMGCRTGQGLMMRILTRALFSKGYLEETFAFEASDYNIYGMSGVFENGTPWGMSNFSLVGAQCSGARAFMDGGISDASGQNPETDYGESEEWETLEPPLLNIMRGITKDACSHGKYRGGMGFTLAHVVNKPGKSFSANDGCAMNAEVTTHCCGSNGSYPGLGHASLFIRGTNMPELMAKGEYPGSYEELQQWLRSGKLTAKEIVHCKGETVAHTLQHGDLLVILAHAPEGWGDPLDRTAANIEHDLDRNLISSETARKIYGAAATQQRNGKWKVDVAATKAAHEKIRKEREELSVPASEWWEKERQVVLDKSFPEIVAPIYRDGLKHEKWGRKWRDFWAVPQTYSV